MLYWKQIIGGKTKMATEIKCGQPGAGKCPDCERREVEMAKAEEINLAVLIALVPAMTAVLFNSMGLL